MKYAKSIVLSLTVGTFGFSQTDKEVYQDFHPEEAVVLIQKSQTMTINMVNGIPEVSTVDIEEHVINDITQASYMQGDNVNFNSFEKVEYIDAHSYNPKGNRFKKKKADGFYTKDSGPAGNIFHDDRKTTTFGYNGLTSGSQRYLGYKKTFVDFKFPTLFVFPSYYPCLSSTFTVDADSSVHMFTKLKGDNKDDIVFTERLENDRRIYEWTIKNQDGVRMEKNAPAITYFGNHVIAQIGYYYNDKGEKVAGVNSIDDLHEWYKDNVKEIEEEEASEEIKRLVDSLVSDSNTEFENVKNIYYWVQSNIKYIAFEDGMGGFVPRPAELVCSRKFGDCKDMASLCYVMLKEAGIKSNLTWIGSRDIPYKYTDVPSLVTDNHMICMYKDTADNYHVLDATSSFQPITLPTSFIQGKQAFIHLGQEKGYEIYEIPVVPAKESMLIDSSFIQIDGKNIKGRNKTEYTGYYNILFNYMVDIKKEDDISHRLEKYREKGNNSFNITKSTLINPKDRDENLITVFDFDIKNYVTSYKDEIYLSLILDKSIVSSKLEDDRKFAFEVDEKCADSYVVCLDLPEGYEVSHLPENVDFDNDKMSFKINYKEENNKLYCTVYLDVNFLILQKEDLSIWNEYVKKLKSSVNENIVLKKK